MLTLVVALCAAQRARCSSNRGETARDRKFGRPRNGLARARRGVTRDGAGKRRCELISLFSVRTLFSKTLVYVRTYVGCTPRGRAYGHGKTTFMRGMIFRNTLIV